MREAESALADASRRLQGRIAGADTPAGPADGPRKQAFRSWDLRRRFVLRGRSVTRCAARPDTRVVCAGSAASSSTMKSSTARTFTAEPPASACSSLSLRRRQERNATPRAPVLRRDRSAEQSGPRAAQHGLHCGEAGLAYFFARLARLLDEPGYLDAAAMAAAPAPRRGVSHA